ncbi:MAG: sigma-70 family RNA polymerase sigma factor [Planctomycetota bacterium]
MLTTRHSLVLRIREVSDTTAWSQFVDIYGPFIYRYGRSRGLQDADAADLAQAVLIEVVRCIERFDYEPKLGRFRNWLMVIARSKLSDLAKKKARLVADGDSANLRILNEQPSQESFEEDWLRQYQEHLFHWAAEQVQGEVEESTWQAFWMTAVENKSASTVAKELKMKVGTVYVAKSRVLTRIRDRIAEIDDTMDQS